MILNKKIFTYICVVAFAFSIFFAALNVSMTFIYFTGAFSVCACIVFSGFKLHVRPERLLFLLPVILSWIWIKEISMSLLAYNVTFTILALIIVFSPLDVSGYKIINIVVLFSFITICIVLLEAVLGTSFSQLLGKMTAKHTQFIAFATSNNVITFAGFLSFSYGVYIYGENTNGYKKWKKLLLILISLFALVFQNGRSNIAFIPFTFAIVYLITGNNKKINRIMNVLFFMGLIATLIIILYPFFSSLPTFSRVIDTLTLFDKGESILSNRGILYSEAINNWKANVFFGSGWFDFFHSHRGIIQQDSYAHVHCLILELLADCGIIGALLVLIPIVYSIRLNVKLIKKCNDRNDKLNHLRFCISVQIFFLLDSMLHVTFYHQQIIAIYLIVQLAFFSIKEGACCYGETDYE